VSTALIQIATGQVYWRYARDLIASAKQFFVPHDVVLFTDSTERFDVKHQFAWPSLGYPRATLHRYHAVMSQRGLLAQYDNIFYADADALFVSQVNEGDIFSDGITATLHGGFYAQNRGGTPERRSASTAYIAGELKQYYCGGFNGGTSAAYLKMAETIRDAVDADHAKGIIAVWHDESHLNCYLHDHPPARVLTPSFCYPPPGYAGGYGWSPDLFKPVLLVLEKPGRV
jgi:hypothetical protein